MKICVSTAVLTLLFIVSTSFHVSDSKSSYTILIDKSDYELSIYDDEGWLVTYPVVFGNKNLGDKMLAGDRKTPEGKFKIISKRIHPKWDRFLMLDYPTPASYEKFYQRKEQGVIPANSSIGGGIGIHGTWPHEDYAIDRYDNWTEGCISMKNKDVEELYQMITIGTPVVIRR